MSSINYQNLFGYIINHQEHLQIGKSYTGKIKIYLNDATPKILLQTELDLNILFRVQIKSHMIHFQI